MHAHFKQFLIVFFLAQFTLFTASAGAYNVIISSVPSFGGSFVANVWTPTTEPSHLSFTDLNAQFTLSDVEVITSGTGNITVSTPFSYTGPDRLLTLSAQGAVTLYGITTTGAALSVTANASGPVTISAVGISLNNGSFTSTGTDFTVEAGGANTGTVLLNHTGTVTLKGPGGLDTNGNSFTSTGTDFLSTDAGLKPGIGNVILNHSGSVTFSGVGLTTNGGTLTSSGTDFSSSTVMNTGGGDVVLNHTGTVNFSGSGLNTGIGSVTGSAGDLLIQNGGLHTVNAAVNFNCTGNITVSDAGLTTNGGSILMESGKSISITGSAFSSGGTNNGGDITLRAYMGITADLAIDSSPGSGGVLSLDGNTAAIQTNPAPVVGGGNITLYVDPSSASIPTLSEWGMIIMLLMLAGSAIWMIRRRQIA